MLPLVLNPHLQCKGMLERLAEYAEALEPGTLVFNVLQENAQPGVGPDTSRARDLITTAEYAPLQTLGLGAELAIWLDGEKAN